MAISSSISKTRERRARDEYQLGIAFFHKKQWRTATRHFSQAEHKCSRDDVHLQCYKAWHGVSLVYSGDVSGLNLCRHAAANENIDATVFQNLALAELKLRHRKRACGAVKRGLMIDPKHRGLLKLHKNMGARRQPCLVFLDRNNPLNKWLGKVTYRRAKNAVARR
ncbi:hypothetical protein DFR30_0759 [Thiogranum longum]|uniref:Tetratricopeptide repeat protein n=1 Tax=Thiogranum longum TaxID=1537524 RepID=A0A4R1H6X4_9GAMM|nr:hypothetical protein [Thiogranum longum]TCK17527.1 hypothetical protein DFR30_0759 [Thiogranum longum]